MPIEKTIEKLLKQIGEDPEREGLLDTPMRVAEAFKFWCQGYNQEPNNVLKSFEDDSSGYDEMVIVKDIPIYSKCEHHLADIFGTATIAYVPNGRVVGLSKLSRLVNIFARRLQVQERMTVQIADALQNSKLSPLGTGVILRCRHMCMESRGLCQQGHHTITSAFRGDMRTGMLRAEFLRLAA
jgi:GTP cyclohydrolase IA